MPRRRYYSYRKKYNNKQDDLENGLAGLLSLALLGLIWYFIVNPGKAIAYISVLVVGVLLFFFLKLKYQKKHFEDLLNKLKDSGEEDNLKNFIRSFGLEGKRGSGYAFRNHKFDWDRINDLKKKLKEKGIIKNEKDTFVLLNHYIQEKEEKFTWEMSKKEPQKFARLTGSDFENLLRRLFEAMGYSVETIGGVGDQGGDLIAVKDGEKTLIQAKCYRDWSTGNAAVQQVVAAMNHYNCNKTMVVTTSYFTPEAIVLAKNNKTELVSKSQLQELLLKYLGENWS